MERHGNEVHITTEEARGASTPNIVRYVLVISLLLVIVALSAVWMTGAANAPQARPADGTPHQAAAPATN